MEEMFECKECRDKYRNAVAGQAFTKFICKKCGQVAWYHNTLTPHYCTSCVEESYICQRCGKNLLVEAVLEHKEKYNLYDAALEIGVSEVSLRKFIKDGDIGYKVKKKIVEWYRNKRNGKRLDR